MKNDFVPKEVLSHPPLTRRFQQIKNPDQLLDRQAMRRVYAATSPTSL
jgi:hypothetical protein